jgi:pyruvate kinase
VFSTNLPSFIEDVQPGHRVLIDDGAVRMLAVDKSGAGADQRLICRVTVAGRVTTAKGLNLPDTDVSVPSLTEYDARCVQWALQHKIDFLALSFVRQAQDIRLLKDKLAVAAAAPGEIAIPVIAKIEKPQAVQNLQAIVQESDGLMVARGDLGVEMDITTVPIIQKRIITMAHDYGKPVIVATQMLQSMIESSWPTRAEVSDVANAIYDGADAVMLSGETAVGRYPVQTVHIMGRIAITTQADLATHAGTLSNPPKKLQESHYRTAALAHGVSVVVRDLGAKLMAIWSQQGGGARYLSQNRPTIPIIAASSDPAVLRRMSLLFAVVPVLMEPPSSLEDFADKIDRLILDRRWASVGDQVVLVAGEPIGVPGVTNTLSIRRLGGLIRVPESS